MELQGATREAALNAIGCALAHENVGQLIVRPSCDQEGLTIVAYAYAATGQSMIVDECNVTPDGHIIVSPYGDGIFADAEVTE